MIKRGFEKISIDEWKRAGMTVDYPALPKRATSGSAGYDIFSPFPFTLTPGDDVLIPTGFKVHMLPDECFKIYSRSGLGFKFYARLANGTGIIDSDYYNNIKNEGHVLIRLRNESKVNTMTIKRDEAIAQGIFEKFLLTDDDEALGVRVGGIGSTGQ